jgi:hypothetical protein
VWEQAQTLDAAATGAALAGILDALGALSEFAASRCSLSVCPGGEDLYGSSRSSGSRSAKVRVPLGA